MSGAGRLLGAVAALLMIGAASGADAPAIVPRPMAPLPAVPLPDLTDLDIPPLPSRVPSPAASPGVASPERPSGLIGSAQTMALFALMSMAPAALLMLTSFVRISIVLTLLRQALGSPQVPGNQVLMALSLLLTVLVMRPVAETTYERGIRPYADGKLGAKEAWEAGSAPIKRFMIEQIVRADRKGYCTELYDLTPHPADAPEPQVMEDYSLAIIAPAFLLSELTTALFLGFAVYLPFLVIDLVVSAVLGAMGLFMLPPATIALPLKLVLFALADGWMLVSGMLLRGFAAS